MNKLTAEELTSAIHQRESEISDLSLHSRDIDSKLRLAQRSVELMKNQLNELDDSPLGKARHFAHEMADYLLGPDTPAQLEPDEYTQGKQGACLHVTYDNLRIFSVRIQMHTGSVTNEMYVFYHPFAGAPEMLADFRSHHLNEFEYAPGAMLEREDAYKVADVIKRYVSAFKLAAEE